MNLANVIAGTLISGLVIAAIVILGLNGTLDGQTVAGLFGALIGGGAVAGSHAVKK